MVKRVEALADSIGKLHGCPNNPESESYKLRNPLLIKSFAKPGKHVTDELGRRAFDSLLAGYKAGLFDLELKIAGKSRAGLRPDDKLENLLGCYDIKEKAAVDCIVAFLRRALQDQTISAKTSLSYFTE